MLLLVLFLLIVSLILSLLKVSIALFICLSANIDILVVCVALMFGHYYLTKLMPRKILRLEH